MRRMLPKLLVLLTAAAVLCSAFAAAAHAALSAEPGQELTLTVPLGKQNSVNVSITSSSPDVASVADVAVSGGLTGTVGLGRVNVFSETASECSLVIRVRVAEDAPAGSASSIGVHGFTQYGDYDPGEFHWDTLVEIPIPSVTEPEDGGETEGAGETSGSAGENPGDETGAGSDGAPVTQTPRPGSGSGGTGVRPGSQSGAEAGVSRLEAELEAERQVLRRQLSILETLPEAAYSLESWNALALAAERARQAESGEDPEELRGAADALEASLGALERMDYSRVTGVIAGAELLLEGSLPEDLAADLKDIAERAEALYALRDPETLQAEAESLSGELSALLEELERRREEERANPPEAQPTAEVRTPEPTPEPPGATSGETPEQRSGPRLDTRVLLGILGALALAGLILGLILARRARKERNERDTTPVVDYDISDDE